MTCASGQLLQPPSGLGRTAGRLCLRPEGCSQQGSTQTGNVGYGLALLLTRILRDACWP